MIDQAFQRAAEKIRTMIPPEWNEFLSDLISSNIFQTMTEDELQIACIKIALEALSLALFLWIVRKIRKAAKKKKEKAAAAPSTEKKFQPKKWKTDGSYYDEKKKKWINPDFK